MSLFGSLRTWWQIRTGEDDTPFDGDSPAWVISMVFHMVVMVLIAAIPMAPKPDDPLVVLSTPTPLEEEPEVVELPQDVQVSDLPQTEVGDQGLGGGGLAGPGVAPVVADVSEVPSAYDFQPFEVGEVLINNTISTPTGLRQDNVAIKGSTGQGTSGTAGAVDRITQEILLSLEQRKTLVVWLFDQTVSLSKQRGEIHDRFERIYQELGILEAADQKSFSRHDDRPLLTSVVGFGKNVTFVTEQPTDNLAQIKDAIANMPIDESGDENIFTAIYQAADRFKLLRRPTEETREPARNVMLIAFTDEVGSDYAAMLEKTINMCRRYEMPVYVIGVPAPFGREKTLVKWIDPDPKYDQTPQWGEVNQGPESLRPEMVKLSMAGFDEEREPMESGFGPFALTRLCYETGGTYFAAHPNRNVNRMVSRNEVEEYSSHIAYFFDPEKMRKYRPDYVSLPEYDRRLAANKARASLVQAAQMSWIEPLTAPETRFVKTSEADLANALSEAQKGAAKLEPRIEQLFQLIRLGEQDRDKEAEPRWQAGYDLAIGRVLAAKVRTESYNAMLAEAKRGKKFKDEKSNTWVLKPAETISVGSQLENLGKKAKMYLNRVVEQHPGTPWALLANKELETPLGWEWSEEHTPTAEERAAANNNNNNNNNNNRPNMMKKPPPRRPPPKL